MTIEVVIVIIEIIIIYLIGISYFMFKRSVGRYRKKGNSKIPPEWEPYLEELKNRINVLKNREHEDVEIVTYDKLHLKGKFFYSAQGLSNKTIIAIHGFRGCGCKEFAMMADFFREMGFNLLLPDNRAHGDSEGKYIGFGIQDSKDCIRWCKLITDKFGKDHEIVLHGTSMGGATVMMASGMDLPENVKAIIEDCGYTSIEAEFSSVLKGFMLKNAYIKIAGFYSKICAGYGFNEMTSIKGVKNAKVPMLFIHGGADKFVPTEMVHEVYEACASEKDILIIEDAAHALSYMKDPEKYEAKVREFLEKHGISVTF